MPVEIFFTSSVVAVDSVKVERILVFGLFCSGENGEFIFLQEFECLGFNFTFRTLLCVDVDACYALDVLYIIAVNIFICLHDQAKCFQIEQFFYSFFIDLG